MTPAVVVAIAAVIIAAISFAASQREFRRRAKTDYVASLERRIEECEQDRDELHKKLGELEDENVKLLRRIVRLEGPS